MLNSKSWMETTAFITSTTLKKTWCPDRGLGLLSELIDEVRHPRAPARDRNEEQAALYGSSFGARRAPPVRRVWASAVTRRARRRSVVDADVATLYERSL